MIAFDNVTGAPVPIVSLVRPLPWTRLECGAEVQLCSGAPVRLRLLTETATPAFLAECRLELWVVSGCLCTLGASWETREAVTFEVRPRGEAHG